MNCKNCGKEIDDSLELCQECQTKAETPAENAKDIISQIKDSKSTPKEKTGCLLNFLKEKAKNILNNYKNFKTLSTKQKIIHIVVPLLIVVILFSSGGGGGMSESEAMAYIATYNMLDSSMSRVFGEVSAADVIGYMFSNPDYEIEKDGEKTYVTVSGKCRTTYGSSDYAYEASVTFSINNESGVVMIKSDTNNGKDIMKSIAVQLAYN